MKKNRNRYILPLLLVAVIISMTALGVARRRNIESNSQLVESYRKPAGDTLAVAIEMSPLTYTLENDTAEGFDYLMLRDMADRNGVTIKFYPFTHLDKAFAQLYEGNYDLIVASMPSTSALKEYFPLTEAVYIDRQVLVQRTADGDSLPAVRSQTELKGDTVWIAKGKPFKTRLGNMAKEIGDTICVVESSDYSSEHLAIMTALGQIRHAVVGHAEARRVARKYPQLDYSTPISLSQFQVWAVAPGDSTLLEQLNGWIEDFKETAQYRNLADRYL